MRPPDENRSTISASTSWRVLLKCDCRAQHAILGQLGPDTIFCSSDVGWVPLGLFSRPFFINRQDWLCLLLAVYLKSSGRLAPSILVLAAAALTAHSCSTRHPLSSGPGGDRHRRVTKRFDLSRQPILPKRTLLKRPATAANLDVLRLALAGLLQVQMQQCLRHSSTLDREAGTNHETAAHAIRNSACRESSCDWRPRTPRVVSASSAPDLCRR